jgi:23S rRNA pseudouridine1911/1915/1917 synthase
MKILFEDNHLLIVQKAPGMLTQPDDSGRENLEDLAKKYVKDHYQKPGAVFLHAVHRLDRPVGGIVVFARTSKALSRLNETLREGKWHRHYRAWVEGNINLQTTLEHYLLRTEEKSTVVNASTPGAKLARLDLKSVAHEKDCTLVEIELDTGRHHQIRLQLSANKTPIVGDGKYGSRNPKATIALEHYKLIFPHPISKQHVIIELRSQFPNII